MGICTSGKSKNTKTLKTYIDEYVVEVKSIQNTKKNKIPLENKVEDNIIIQEKNFNEIIIDNKHIQDEKEIERIELPNKKVDGGYENQFKIINHDNENQFDSQTKIKHKVDKLEKVYENDECPICLETYTSEIQKQFINCGHLFCKSCIDKALSIRCFCPLCGVYAGEDRILKNTKTNAQDWNVEMVRAFFKPNHDRPGWKNVVISGFCMQKVTNIQVRNGAKINVGPNADIFIKGKKVENPQQCTHQ